MKQTEIKKVVNAIEKKIDLILPDLIEEAKQKAESELNQEIERLESLSQVNDSVRPEEIEFLKIQKEKTLEVIDSAQAQMNAIRILVCL